MNSTIQQNYKKGMDTIFMNSEVLTLTEKINLKRSDTYIPLSNISIYYTWKTMKKSYKKNKFKISAPTWTELELPNGSILF